MKLLAIDTSTQVMSVAVFNTEEQAILGEIITNIPQNHATSLMPSISHLLKTTGSTLKEMGAIAVTSGPGSYTGMRIGVTTAKTLAWAQEVPLYSASSLATLAMNALHWDGMLVPLFDARRERVYTGLYQSRRGQLLEVLPDRVVPMKDWLEEVKRLDAPVRFLGDIEEYKSVIQAAMDERAAFGNSIENTPRAAQLALLGYRKWVNQAESEEIHFSPNYCQVTEVEAKLEEQQKKQGK